MRRVKGVSFGIAEYSLSVARDLHQVRPMSPKISSIALTFLLLSACGGSSTNHRMAIGVAHIEKGHFELAEGELQAELDQHPQSKGAIYELGRLAALRGQGTESAAYFKRALMAAPNNPSCHANLGWVLVSGDDFDASMEHFGHAVMLKAEKSSALAGLGVLALRQGNSEEARVQLQLALQSNPQNSVAHDFLEVIRTGEAEEALGPEMLPRVASVLFRAYADTTNDVVAEQERKQQLGDQYNF